MAARCAPPPPARLPLPTHSDLAPDAVQAGDALVALDALVAPVTLDGGIALDPGVLHHLREAGGGMLQPQALQPPLWLCGYFLDLGFGGGLSHGVLAGTALSKARPGTAMTGLCCPVQHTGATGPLQAPAPLRNQVRDGAPEAGNVQELQTPGRKNKQQNMQDTGAGDGRARDVLCTGHLLTLVFLLDLA